MTYETSGLGSNANTCLYVYRNGNLTSPVATDCGASGAYIEQGIALADLYYVKIRNSGGFVGPNTEYTITITYTPAGTPDGYEDDDVWSDASSYGGIPQDHNFGDDDVDWIMVWMNGAGTMTYQTYDLDPSVDTCMYVYHESNLFSPVAQDCGAAGAYIEESISQAGLYYVEVTNQNGYVGDGTDYTIWMSYSSN